VAIGGDADFTQGFSIGSHLQGTDRLPGGNALVVGGTLRTGDSAYAVLGQGIAFYAQLMGRKVELKGGHITWGASRIDFGAECGELRSLSSKLTAIPASGRADRTQDGGDATLTLRGTDPRLNVIDISTQQLQDAKHIVVDAPADAVVVVVVVDVSGASYDMNAGGT
jgi:choice-of-anchor A domain-containing protein